MVHFRVFRRRGFSGPQARAKQTGGPSRSLAIRTKLQAATTYWLAAWVRSTPRYRLLRKQPVVLPQPKISSIRLRERWLRAYACERTRTPKVRRWSHAAGCGITPCARTPSMKPRELYPHSSRNRRGGADAHNPRDGRWGSGGSM